MPKIKDVNFDDDIFNEFIESDNKPKSKNKNTNNKKKKKNKNKTNKKKKKKKGNNKKNNAVKKEYSYEGNSLVTTHKIYTNKTNKSFFSRLLDGFNMNVDLESKVDVSIKDETIAAAINVGSELLKALIRKIK